MEAGSGPASTLGLRIGGEVGSKLARSTKQASCLDPQVLNNPSESYYLGVLNIDY